MEKRNEAPRGDKRGIELIPFPSKRETIKQRALKYIRNFGFPFVIITQLTLVLILSTRLKLEQDLATLQKSLDQKTAVIEKNQSFENTFVRTQEKISFLENLALEEKCASCVFEFLKEKSVKYGMFFLSISMGKENISLIAEAQNGLVFAQFISNLTKEERVKSLVLTASNLTDKKTFIFSIDVGIDPQDF